MSGFVLGALACQHAALAGSCATPDLHLSYVLKAAA
jgi:hypothetical protein